MNLVDLVTRKDPVLLEVPEGLEVCIHGPAGRRMHAVRFRPDRSLVIGDLGCFQELAEAPIDLGWFVSRGSPPTGAGTAEVTCLCHLATGAPLVVAHQQLPAGTSAWLPLAFDWHAVPDRSVADRLEIAFRGDRSQPLVVGVADAADLRRPLYDLARGDGVEIGPGTSPQIAPADGVNVRYLERSPLDEWAAWYQKKDAGDVLDRVRALWDRYVIGDAQRLDGIAPRALDFIFSSHVFEHLVNPLGTLEVWKSRLRPGGRVLAVVPDAHNCFDWRRPLSVEPEWIDEWRRGVWSYETRHYEKWCSYTAGRPTSLDAVRSRGYSIHAHYYTPRSFHRLLDLAVEHLGFRAFQIWSAQNRKDFSWVLEA